jgi:hypothetical protein
MSEKLGPRVFGHDHGQPFLGREFSSEPDYSDDVAREIDDEIRRIVEDAHQTARAVLEQHREQLDYVSEILLRRETIEREEFIQLLDGKTEEDVFGRDQPTPVPPAPRRERQHRKARLPNGVSTDREPSPARSPASSRTVRSRRWAIPRQWDFSQPGMGIGAHRLGHIRTPR